MTGIRLSLLVMVQIGFFAGCGLLLGDLPGLLLAAATAVLSMAIAGAVLQAHVLGSPQVREVDLSSEKDLFNGLQDLARRAGIPPPRLYVLDHAEPNAFACGNRAANSAIIVTSGLLRELDNQQLIAVIAHEVAHIRRLDIQLMMIVMVVTTIITGVAALVLLIARTVRPGGSALIALLGWTGAAAALVVGFAIGRETEYEADAAASTLCGHPEWLISALRAIEDCSHRRRLAPVSVPAAVAPFLFVQNQPTDWIFSLHPPVRARIARLKAMRQDSLAPKLMR